MKKYKTCQSCGMPLKRDPQQGGTEKDGSRSAMYCSYCYNNGAFVQPDITLDEMKSLVVDNMKKIGFPGFIARFFTKGMSKLERWKR